MSATIGIPDREWIPQLLFHQLFWSAYPLPPRIQFVESKTFVKYVFPDRAKSFFFYETTCSYNAEKLMARQSSPSKIFDLSLVQIWECWFA